MGFVLVILKFFSYAGGLALSTFCIAAALYYIAQIIEEYERIAKKTVKYAIYTLLSGIVAHLIYMSLLRSFPRIQLTSIPFILSLCAFIVNKWLWLNYIMAEVYNFDEACAYLLILVWTIPFCIIVSLTYEDTLPYGSTINSSGEIIGPSKARSSNVIMSIFQTLLGKKDRFTSSDWRGSSAYD